MCFDFLYNLRLKHFSFWEELSEIWLKVYVGLHVQYRLFFSDVNETWMVSTDFRKIFKCQISRNSVRLEPNCSMRDRLGNQTGRQAGRQADWYEEAVALGNFTKALKKKGVKIHGLWAKASSLLLPIDRQYFELLTACSKQQTASTRRILFTNGLGVVSHNN